MSIVKVNISMIYTNHSLVYFCDTCKTFISSKKIKRWCTDLLSGYSSFADCTSTDAGAWLSCADLSSVPTILADKSQLPISSICGSPEILRVWWHSGGNRCPTGAQPAPNRCPTGTQPSTNRHPNRVHLVPNRRPNRAHQCVGADGRRLL